MLRKLTPALLAPLLLLFAACAQPADDSAIRVEVGPAAALRDAPDRSASASTARFEMTITAGATGATGAYSVRATGAYDEAGQRMQMELDLGDGAESAGLGGATEMVIDGTTVYVRAPLLETLSGTVGWLSVAADARALGSNDLASGVSDPTQMLEVLRGVADDVTEIGRDDIRGVRTTHYAATVDVEGLYDDLPADARTAVKTQLGELGPPLGAVPVEVWLDDDGLPRRLEISVAAGDDAEASFGATMQIDLFDYGQPVDIEVPPAEEVTSADQLGGLFGWGADAR